MTFNTGNPIGSTDARDLSDNAENFDKALGTLDATWTDRLGVTRDSFEGRLAKGSFYRVGDFTTGYTLTNMRQTLEYSGHEYSWAGTFPKVVVAGSTPATSGGIGAGAWVDRTDVVLRDEVRETTFQTMKRSYAEAGFNLVDGSFQMGGSLSGWPDVLWDWATGVAYQWHLDEAKTIPSGSTPATSGGIGAGAWVDRTDETLRSELENEKSNFVNIKSYDYLNDPTAAFYSALSDSGYIDLMGVDITVTVTSQTAINKDVYIKNGTIRFVAPGLTSVFSLQSCRLFRFERCKLYGNSNGSINDSFNTTSGTYSLAQAQLVSDGSVSNVELDECYVYGMIILDDNKHRQGSTGRYFVDGGYARKCKFEHVPGHAFSFNMWKNFTIEKNKFKDIGALCADFSTATTDCSFVDNDIDNAAGIAKTQNHYSYNSGNIPLRNKINRNRAINLTGGTSSNVAIVKASGYKTEILENDIECAGTMAVESFELYGSTKCKGNTVIRTTNLTRSFVTTFTDANSVTAYGKQVFEITHNPSDGALYFCRGQNTSASKVKCNRNNIKNAQRLFFAEASFNAPNMELNFNDVDTSAYATNPVQMSNSITALDGFSMVGNAITGQGVLYLVGANRGKLTANTLINTAGTSMLALINTTSISVVGNSGNYSWGTTSGQVIIEHNTVY